MSAKRKLLIIDCETGGLDPANTSILSIAAVVWNQGAIEDQFYTLVAEPTIIANASALKVNKLTVERVQAEGMSPSNTFDAIRMMMMKHDMRGAVTLAGHNVAFDVGYLKRLMRLAGILDKNYGEYFSYRSLCTITGALLLEQAGRIELPGGSASLDSLVKLWNITLSREGGHNALNDALATAKVLNRELELMGGLR
jgi:DNA polymerase III epsilon subunit-like protein